MSRGPQITQAEYDYLKQLQKRKVGAVEAGVQTGRNIKTVQSIYRSADMAAYKAALARRRKLTQQALPIKVATVEHDVATAKTARTLEEAVQAIENLSSLYWSLRNRIEVLEKANAALKAEALRQLNDSAMNRRKWRF